LSNRVPGLRPSFLARNFLEFNLHLSGGMR
jgi:hypothetical protein